jgi:hypothetical protein
MVMLPVAAGAAFLGYAIFWALRDYQKHNTPAWNAGFTNADEMDVAKRDGFSDPSTWHAELGRRQAERAAQTTRIEAAKAQMKAREDAEKEAETPNSRSQSEVPSCCARA